MNITVTEFRKLFPDIARHCDEKGLTALLNAMEQKQVKKGEVVVREGEHSSELYLVQDGELATSLSGNGQTVDMGTITAGHTICKRNLLDPGPATVTATAVTEAQLLVLSQAAFRALEQQDLKMTGNLLRMLSDELIELCSNADRILFNRSSGIVEEEEQASPSGLKTWAAKVYRSLQTQRSERP